MLPALSQSSTVGPDILCTPDLQAQSLPLSGSPNALSSNEATLQHQQQLSPQLPTLHPRAQSDLTTTSGTQGQDYFGPRAVSSGGSSGLLAPTTPDDPSGGSGTGQGGGHSAMSTPGGGLMGKLRGLGRTTKRVQGESAPGTPGLPSQVRTPAATATAVASPAAGVPSAQTPAARQAPPQEPPPPVKTRTAAVAVLATGPLSPPSAADGPALPITPDIPLLVAEERAHGWAIVYRGTVASAGSADDVETLEDAMPIWLLEYLLLGRTPQVAVLKIGFVLLPMQSGQPGEEVLPELVNT
jgi:WD repeat-containing protein 48